MIGRECARTGWFFYCRDLFGEVDLLTMKETQPDGLFAAWLNLPDEQRNNMRHDCTAEMETNSSVAL